MRLEDLSPAKQARHNSAQSKETRRRKCSPNTRAIVLTSLNVWANNPNSPKIYWMSGMAGTGKTTITYSLCDGLNRDFQLGASFFCSRLLPDCRNVTLIVPTIAYQLASFSHAFQSALCVVLGRDRDISTYDIDTQFEKLVREPLLQVKDTMPTNAVVVIDALDECSDENGTQMILEMLFRCVSDMPIKFFVTSRPEPSISEKIMSGDSRSRSILILHDIDRSVVQADIETYLSTELAALSPHPDQIRQLAERAGHLFIYAATIIQYILPDKRRVDPHERLKTMLEITSKRQTKEHKNIDILYADIVESALEDEDLEPWEVENTKLILDTIICAREPMAAQVLGSLLGLGHERLVLSALRSLLSVLYIYPDSGFISAFHASFPDYMLSVERSGRFFCNKAQHHQLLACRCFEVMKDSLRFNICNLESPYVFDQDVLDIDDRINNAISPELFYACRYWADHLESAEPSDALCSLLSEFIQTQLLFWVEVLNLKQCIKNSEMMLSKAHKWSTVSVEIRDIRPNDQTCTEI
jgi:hypothetical protein